MAGYGLFFSRREPPLRAFDELVRVEGGRVEGLLDVEQRLQLRERLGDEVRVVPAELSRALRLGGGRVDAVLGRHRDLPLGECLRDVATLVLRNEVLDALFRIDDAEVE